MPGGPTARGAPRSENDDYCVAIALNNVGVSLLVRGAHREALLTFQDSVHVLRRVSAAEHADPTDHVTTNNDMLRLAEKRLSVASRQPRASDGVYPISHEGSAFHGLCFTADLADTTIFQFFPTWIECSAVNLLFDREPSPRENEGQEIELQFSLVLYNFAVAHSYGAQNTRTHPASEADVEMLQHGAVQLLKMAHRILDEDVNTAYWSSLNDSRLVLVCLSLMLMKVIAQQHGSLVDAVQASDELDQAVAAWHRWSLIASDLFDDAVAVERVFGETQHSIAEELAEHEHYYLCVHQRTEKAPAA
jgi:hypothetical protein